MCCDVGLIYLSTNLSRRVCLGCVRVSCLYSGRWCVLFINRSRYLTRQKWATLRAYGWVWPAKPHSSGPNQWRNTKQTRRKQEVKKGCLNKNMEYVCVRSISSMQCARTQHPMCRTNNVNRYYWDRSPSSEWMKVIWVWHMGVKIKVKLMIGWLKVLFFFQGREKYIFVNRGQNVCLCCCTRVSRLMPVPMIASCRFILIGRTFPSTLLSENFILRGNGSCFKESALLFRIASSG